MIEKLETCSKTEPHICKSFHLDEPLVAKINELVEGHNTVIRHIEGLHERVNKLENTEWFGGNKLEKIPGRPADKSSLTT